MTTKGNTNIGLNNKTKMKIDKAKYKYKSSKSANSKGLNIDLKGFLCSCNNREKDCVRESYNILNKYADELYGTENPKSDDAEENNDIQDELAKELQALKQQKNECKYRFQSLNSGAKNLIFVSTTLENPAELAYKIITDIHYSKKQQTRFLLRLIPIEVTCKAHLKNIEKALEPLIQRYFKDRPTSFSVIFNHRLNDSLSKDETIKMIADHIMAVRPDHKVNLKEADVSVVVEVIKSIALIGIVPGYLKYKKYNLHSICSDDSVQKRNPDSVAVSNS